MMFVTYIKRKFYFWIILNYTLTIFTAISIKRFQIYFFILIFLLIFLNLPKYFLPLTIYLVYDEKNIPLYIQQLAKGVFT